METKTILVADDEEDVLAVLTKRLSTTGYKVLSAPDGPTALELAKSRPPDIAILDVLMPKMQGAEVAENLHSLPGLSKLPIIFLTGMFPKRDDDENGRPIAGTVMFSKPYNAEALLAQISRMLKEAEAPA